MCFNFKNNLRPLPTRFATGEDEDVVLLTFKRERK